MSTGRRAARNRRRRASRFPRWPGLDSAALIEVIGRLGRLRLSRPQMSPIAGQVWTRASLHRPRQLARWRRWRLVAGATATLEVVALAWLALGPAFQVRHVEVQGTNHLTRAQVIALAGLSRPSSVFAVDPQGARRRLGGTPWVRTAEVTAMMPDRVVVRVEEWTPVAVYHAGGGAGIFLSDQAVALGPAATPAGLTEILGPAQPEARPGRQAMDVQLLTALVNIQRAFPTVYNQQVARFQTDCVGNLAMDTAKGWRVYFGRVITPDEFTALRVKLGTLKSVQAREDFNSPDLEYVNLMDGTLPAVKHRSTGPGPAPAVPSPLCH